jgi:hypothetical protein
VLLTFWLPAFLAVFTTAIVSSIVAYFSGAGQLAFLAIFPVPLGLLAGYVQRPTFLIVAQVIVGALFALTTVWLSGSISALFGTACVCVMLVLPIGLGYLMGLVLRRQLQQSRWSQRWFL